MFGRYDYSMFPIFTIPNPTPALNLTCYPLNLLFKTTKPPLTRDVLVFVNSTNTTSLARWLPARCTAQQGTQPILTSDCVTGAPERYISDETDEGFTNVPLMS